MGLFDKFRDGFKKTQDKLVHEIKPAEMKIPIRNKR